MTDLNAELVAGETRLEALRGEQSQTESKREASKWKLDEQNCQIVDTERRRRELLESITQKDNKMRVRNAEYQEKSHELNYAK